MFGFAKKTQMPDAKEALPGRPTAIPTASAAFRQRSPVVPPFPAGLRDGVFGMGCFWGAERNSGSPRRRLLRGGLRGGHHAEPDLRGGLLGRTGHTRWSASCSTRSVSLRGAAEAVLGEPRPDPGHAPGERRGHAVPLRIYVYGRSSSERPKRRARPTRRSSPPRASARSRPRSATRREFYFAEDYHQQYLAKNPDGYCGLGGTGVPARSVPGWPRNRFPSSPARSEHASGETVPDAATVRDC